MLPVQGQTDCKSIVIQGEDPVAILPEELIRHIFSFLDLQSLSRSRQVNKRWRALASDHTLLDTIDLRKISPLIRIFDGADWDAHVDLASQGLSVEDESLLNKREVIPVLTGLLSFLPVEGDLGFTLLTIPKGLTLNKLIQLAGSPKLGSPANVRYTWDLVITELGDIAVDKTYRVGITNNIFLGSRELSIIAQKELVSKYECEMPKVLEAVALLVMTFMSSDKQRLYGDSPWTYTRCLERIDPWPLVVGGFVPSGLGVDGNCCDTRGVGVGGALRKF